MDVRWHPTELFTGCRVQLVDELKYGIQLRRVTDTPRQVSKDCSRAAARIRGLSQESNFRGLSLPGLGARKAASEPDMLVQGGIRARGKHPERRKGRGPSVGTKDAVCMAPRIPKACQRTKMEAPTSLGPRNLQRWPTFRLFALVVPSQGVSCLLAFHCLPQLLEAAFFFFIPLFTRSLVGHPTKETLFWNL